MKSCRTVLIVAGLLTCCFSFEADAAGALVRGSNDELLLGVQAYFSVRPPSRVENTERGGAG